MGRADDEAPLPVPMIALVEAVLESCFHSIPSSPNLFSDIELINLLYGDKIVFNEQNTFISNINI